MLKQDGHWSKVIRAEEHFASVRAEIDFYREMDVYRAVGKFETDEDYVIRIKLRREPSPRLSILIGDCLTCLRSALDHLAFALVDRWAPQRIIDEPKSIEFPIYDTLTKEGKLPVLHGVRGIDAAPLAIIEREQPHHRGNDALSCPLSVINRLANADKHRVLLVTASCLTHGSWGVRCGSRVFRSTYVYTDGFKPGAQVAHFKLTPAEIIEAGFSLDQVDVYGYAPALVTFDEAEAPFEHPVLDVLAELIQYVRGLIAEIAQAGGLI